MCAELSLSGTMYICMRQLVNMCILVGLYHEIHKALSTSKRHVLKAGFVDEIPAAIQTLCLMCAGTAGLTESLVVTSRACVTF